jgi:tetratricopeptide (TPR) repeat protein
MSRRTSRNVLVAAGLCVLTIVAGCAGGPPLRARESTAGGIVVEIRQDQTFDDIARAIYGDPALGRTVAEISHLPYERGARRGVLLVLPSQAELGDRGEAVRQAEARFREGLEAVRSGMFRVAATCFREALEITPERAEMRHNLGLALLRAGELEEATIVLEEAATLNPGDAETRYAFGSALRKRLAHARALREFDAALDLDPDHEGAAFARARSLEDLGLVDEARQAWRSFLQRFPGSRWSEQARASLAELEEP